MDWEKATADLSRKLDPAHVKGRKQGGGTVQYIEGWHAIAEMNRIFGFGAWDRETLDIRQLGEAREVDGKQRVDYMARVRITITLEDGKPVTRDGCGFGQGIDRDTGQAHESALKEAETDAMKRAMMTLGNPFGLALYDKSRENVGVDLPAFDPNACAIRIKNAIGKAKTKQELTDLWTAEESNLRALKDDHPATYGPLKAAFAEAGKSLIDDPARQAPGAEQDEAA